jgi:hypothetical protein
VRNTEQDVSVGREEFAPGGYITRHR